MSSHSHSHLLPKSAPACFSVLLSAESICDQFIPATYDEIQKIASRAYADLQDKGWPGMAASAVELLLNEHANNSVEHGRLKSTDRLQVQFGLRGAYCFISVTDPGPAWDADKCLSVGAEMPADDCECGRGIGIVYRLTEEFNYCRYENQNTAFFVVSKAVFV